jgi:hypothetical protein
VAILGHLEPFPLENHIRIIALTLDLQKVSLYSIIDFLHYNVTTELIPSPMLYKGVLSEFSDLTTISESSSALWLLWRADSCKIATRVGTSDQSERQFWLVRNSPARSHNIYAEFQLCNHLQSVAAFITCGGAGMCG